MDISKYTIISNSCVGARMYQHLNRQFDNPFIWCMVLREDVITMLNNWKYINFKRYKLIDEDKENNVPYGVNIDKKITIYYPHYIKDKNCPEPTRYANGESGLDIRYCNIEDYMKEDYERRISRMTKNKKPFFVFVQSARTKLGSFESLLEVQKCAIKNRVESVIICNCEELKKYQTTKNLVIVYNRDIFKTSTYTIAKDLMNKLGI